MAGGWRFDYQPSEALPPLAWVARVTDSVVNVRCGASVRCTEHGLAEGTWVGENSIQAIPGSTTVFGTALVAVGEDLIAVPPSHPLERVYFHTSDAGTVVSNSLVAVLDAADLELDPTVLYPPIFVAAADGVRNPTMDVPTLGGPVKAGVYYNFRVTARGAEADARPRERAFATFEDFRDRAIAALRSAVANAPGYEMSVALSSGYDSTAVAAMATVVGCTKTLSFAEAKPVPSGESAADSGELAARQLGMSNEIFDRLAYMRRNDLPEAEFLATGMSGEDVVMVAMEPALRRTILLTGAEEFRLKGGPRRSALYRGDLSSCSLTEFRLRTDFIHLPLLFFGASEKFSLIDITDSPPMRPWTMPGHYDKPIQRRLAEEGGVARGTFATVKRRASATIHRDGLTAMAPASAAAVRDFARAEGRAVPVGQRRRVGLATRATLRVARHFKIFGWPQSMSSARRRLLHADPALGSLLFRWSVTAIRSRYADADLKSSADA